MNLENIPTGIIVFLLGQTVMGVLALIKLYYSFQALEKKVQEQEKEHKELRGQIKELSDTLLIVKNNTDLLVLGKLKTGAK